MREDRFTNTERDAGRFEARRGADDPDDRPTLAELQRDDCLHLHQTDAADFENDPMLLPIWVCDDCGQRCGP